MTHVCIHITTAQHIHMYITYASEQYILDSVCISTTWYVYIYINTVWYVCIYTYMNILVQCVSHVHVLLYDNNI